MRDYVIIILLVIGAFVVDAWLAKSFRRQVVIEKIRIDAQRADVQILANAIEGRRL